MATMRIFPGKWAVRLSPAFLAIMLAACATPPQQSTTVTPHYKVGAPYEINGRRYFPREDPTYDREGVASWYGRQFQGKPTANGEIFDKARLTAAHKTLPLPSFVQVENLENGRSITVRVNDRGPFVDDRIIDLSQAAARSLGFEEKGLASVRVRFLSAAPLPSQSASPRKNRRNPSRERPNAERSVLKQKQLAAPSLPSPRSSPPAGQSARAADPIADLIGTVSSQKSLASPASQTGAAVVSVWVRVGSLASPAAAEIARDALSDLGPAQFKGNTPGGNALFFGPYRDVVTAEAWRAAAIDAGYGDAGLVSSPY